MDFGLLLAIIPVRSGAGATYYLGTSALKLQAPAVYNSVLKLFQ